MNFYRSDKMTMILQRLPWLQMFFPALSPYPPCVTMPPGLRVFYRYACGLPIEDREGQR